jgi:hypothetical protein
MLMCLETEGLVCRLFRGYRHRNVKNERTNVRYRFGSETKRFGIIPEFLLLKIDCFDLVQNLLSWTK